MFLVDLQKQDRLIDIYFENASIFFRTRAKIQVVGSIKCPY